MNHVCPKTSTFPFISDCEQSLFNSVGSRHSDIYYATKAYYLHNYVYVTGSVDENTPFDCQKLFTYTCVHTHLKHTHLHLLDSPQYTMIDQHTYSFNLQAHSQLVKRPRALKYNPGKATKGSMGHATLMSLSLKDPTPYNINNQVAASI